MSRTFSPSELSTLTHAEYCAMSDEDQASFDRAWLAACTARTAEREAKYISGDLDRLGSYRRYKVGE